MRPMIFLYENKDYVFACSSCALTTVAYSFWNVHAADSLIRGEDVADHSFSRANQNTIYNC